MNRVGFWSVVVAAACIPIGTNAATSPESVSVSPIQLSSAYPLVAGDMAAIAMSSNLPAARVVAPGLDAAIAFGYDRSAGKVVVSIYGDLNTKYFGALRPVDRAKAALDYFRTQLFPILKNRAEVAHEISPSESELRLVYFDTLGELREIIRWEDGKYLVAR